jgi:hypothetical protein
MEEPRRKRREGNSMEGRKGKGKLIQRKRLQKTFIPSRGKTELCCQPA